MKGFITTARVSDEAVQLLSDRDAAVKFYKELLSGNLNFAVSSRGADFSVSTTTALASDTPVLRTGTDNI